MTWKITPGWTPADSDAAAYIAAVEAADGQALENGVKVAIDNFVLGCKADGIWNAIKASCILAGARTLNGALVPLVGTAPTNSNFVSGDYNRKTGLVGDGSTKYLDSNRNNNADPQDSFHLSVYSTQAGLTDKVLGGAGVTSAETGVSNITRFGATLIFRVRTNSTSSFGSSGSTGLIGASRSTASEYARRVGQTTSVHTQTSQTPYNGKISVFCAGAGVGISADRLAFYSIGESLDLALLDTRVTTLIAQFAAAIP